MAKTILVVDDNEINRKLLYKILSTDYKVEEAADGQQALALLNWKYHMISAVLLDLGMPVLDGYDVLEQMQQNPLLALIPVIVTTGDMEISSEKRALALGANDVIAKPFDPDVIKRRLFNLIKLRETAAMVNTLQRDKLTGLWNRETFFEKAAWEIKRQPAGHFVLACLDIDNFKVINDQYGTQMGDNVLRELGRILQRNSELNGNLCGRIGGDEFGVLYDILYMTTEAHEQRLNETSIVENLPLPVTISIGQYIVTDKSLNISAMYDRAAMAQQTVKGRYDVHMAVYDEAMRSHILHEQEIVGSMNAALREHQFEVWYQPQYNHATGALIGAEALVRWRHPKRGLVSPGEFIPVFERNGSIYELDKEIWTQVCTHLRGWLDAGKTPLPVSVNISRYDLINEDIIVMLSGLIARYDLPVELLRLEITESAFSENTGQLVGVVKSLIRQGFTVEIDDFGSGYSSLNTLKDVPAQVLKLDMRFLENNTYDDGTMHNEAASRGGNILESIVRMAKWLDMTVIAEGVETIEQANYLKSIGCVYVQGYLYARPMPLAEYERLAEGLGKEEMLAALETVRNLDNNDFWNPESMDTLIFNSYIGGACIFEAHHRDLELLRINDKYAEVLGGTCMTHEEAMHLRLARHVDAENLDILYGNIKNAIDTGEESACEIKLTDIKGNDVYIHATMRAIAHAGDRALVYCSINNITERVLALQRIQKADAQLYSLNRTLQTMMDDTPDGRMLSHAAIMPVSQEEHMVYKQIMLLADDIPVGLATYEYTPERTRITYFNDGCCKLLGCTREEYAEICATGVTNMTDANDVPRIAAQVQALVQNGTPIDCTYRVSPKGGGSKWINLRGNLCVRDGETCYYNVAIFDVTQAHELNVMQALNNARLMAALKTVYPIVIAVNLTQNTYEVIAGNRQLDSLVDARGNIETLVSGTAARMEPEYAELFIKKFSVDRLPEIFSETGDSIRMECKKQGGNRERWLETLAIRTQNDYTSDVTGVVVCRFIDAQKTMEDKLRLAEIDGMTGVNNKTAAEEVIAERLSTRSGRPCSLLVADLDNLKTINDTLGHDQGDTAIKRMADLLRAQFRQSDIVGRMGGDEFVVFVSDITRARINSIMVAFMHKLANMRVGRDKDVPLRGSVGIAMGVEGVDNYETLFKHADKALYHVKRNGKDDFAFYTPEMEQANYSYESKIEASKWQDGNFDTEEMHNLLRAVVTVYPLVASVNLTHNSYYMMQHEQHMTHPAGHAGRFDAWMQTDIETYHPDDRAAFAAVFTRESLLNAHARGLAMVSYSGKQKGDDGKYRLVRTDAVFVPDKTNGDVTAIVLSRAANNAKIERDTAQ